MKAIFKNTLEKFMAQAAADKKKSTVLGILVCVLLAVVGRQLLPASSEATLTPSAARGAPPSSVQPVATKVTPQRELIHRPTINAPSRSELIRPLPPDEPAVKPKVVAVDRVSRTLDRDLFTTSNWAAYPPAIAPASTGDSSKKGRDGFWSNLARAAGDYQAARRAEAQAMAKELASLKLQSTMTGASPLAYISGRLVREGDQVAGFSVLHIENRRVLLSKSGYVHTLALP